MGADGTVTIRGMMVCSFRFSGRVTPQTGMMWVLGVRAKPPEVETNQSILDPCPTWTTSDRKVRTTEETSCRSKMGTRNHFARPRIDNSLQSLTFIPS